MNNATLAMLSMLKIMDGLEMTGDPVDTENDLKEADRAYSKWFDAVSEKWTAAQKMDAETAILGYANSLSQFRYEEGICDGIRLMHDALNGHRSLEEIFKR